MGGPMQLEPVLFKSQSYFSCVCVLSPREHSESSHMYKSRCMTVTTIANAALQVNSNEDSNRGCQLLEGYTAVWQEEAAMLELQPQ